MIIYNLTNKHLQFITHCNVYFYAMLKYKGIFNKKQMIKEAMGYLNAYSLGGRIDEVEIPFESEDGTQKGHVQFVKIIETWVFVRVRKG